MRRPFFPVTAGTAALLATALLSSACQEQPGSTGPELRATKVDRVLSVTGGGNGVGTVTAPDYGEAGALVCEISGGTTSPTACTRTYGWKTSVVITATPGQGSSFTGWSGACNGTASSCKVMMTQSRSVRASFSGPGTPSFVVNVSGGGDGSGSVASAPGPTPAISCTITSGSAVSGGCSQSYPEGTVLSLTASAASGNTFEGWSGDCAGPNPCSITVSGNRAVTATLTAPPGVEATVGRWDAARSTPVIGIHLNHLLTGKALLWGHAGQPQLYNPVGGSFTQVAFTSCADPTTCKVFCAGHTYLADGRLLVAGGHNESLGDGNGLRQATLFDGASWEPTATMTYARWYPTLVTLADGQVVALSGSQTPGTNASVPERYNGSSWTALTGANLSLPLYPRAFLEPKNGYVFVAGEGTTRFLNPNGTGSWTTGPTRVVSDRSYGSAVMLDSKVLYIGGGGGGSCPNNLPQASAEIIDLAATSPAWSLTGSMAIRRRQTNATILADGSVLVTGGSSQCGFTNEAGAVFTAELWNPATGAWTSMANAGVVRVYHSTTLLLADGRVMVTGSGEGGGVTNQYSYEIFSPPYLFKGPRPTYNLAATTMRYTQSFTVATPNAAAIRKVTIIRLASSTHAFDMGERLNTLSFTPATDGQSLTVQAPASGLIAPPGPYQLFIINDKGVPSVAQTVMVGP